jgi:hypothetical protein
MDADDLTPTEYLVMEVLAARVRLGESHWTFPTRIRPALRSLEAKKLIGWKSGVVGNTCRAWLTLDGEHMFLSMTYVAPASQ